MPIPKTNMTNFNDYYFLKSFDTHIRMIQKYKSDLKR